jgi:hypothetical protein
MSEKPNAAVNGPQLAAVSLDELLHEVSGRTRDEKRALLDRILRDLIGEKPTQDYALPNPNGSSYMFLVTPDRHRKMRETPEFLAELDRRTKTPGNLIPMSDVLAKLDAMQAAEDARLAAEKDS